jgi:hypothetical protein
VTPRLLDHAGSSRARSANILADPLWEQFAALLPEGRSPVDREQRGIERSVVEKTSSWHDAHEKLVCEVAHPKRLESLQSAKPTMTYPRSL